MFKKAVKHDSKLRLALSGPSGSGKTYTLLTLATELGGPIAYVDTEHGSASKYADLFQFDVVEPETYDPRELIKMIGAAAENGYKVICIDSLSHYWMGEGGELDQVDAAAKRIQGNSFAAWRHITPLHNRLVDTIISSPIHVMVSMRTKTEWVIEEVNGKKTPRKIGLQPVMRDGIEFEFDVCGDMDQDNTLTITKSRCSALAGKVINRPGKPMAEVLKVWLSGAPVPATQQSATTVQAPASNPAPAAQTVVNADPEEKDPDVLALWSMIGTNAQKIGNAFEQYRKSMNEISGDDVEYERILFSHGMRDTSPEEIKRVRMGAVRKAIREVWLTNKKWVTANTPPPAESTEPTKEEEPNAFDAHMAEVSNA